MGLLILCMYLLFKSLNTFNFEKNVPSISDLSIEKQKELYDIKNNYDKYCMLNYLKSNKISIHNKLKKIEESNDNIYSNNLLASGLQDEINEFLEDRK